MRGLTFIEKGKLRWFGYVNRMSNFRCAKRYYEYRLMKERGWGGGRVLNGERT